MKQIYFILSHSGTLLSRLIKLYTNYSFSHVSISLDKNLTTMYSFGRIHPSNPFVGGFVLEHLNKGMYKKFNKTVAEVYSLDVTDQQYQDIKKLIQNFEIKRKEYRYNFLGLIAIVLHVKWNRHNYFYCAEFVKYLMDKSNITNNLPAIVTPECFTNLKGLTAVYKGYLNNYCYN